MTYLNAQLGFTQLNTHLSRGLPVFINFTAYVFFNIFPHSPLRPFSRFRVPLVFFKDVSLYLIFPWIWRSHKFSLRDTPFFLLKISMPQKGSRSRLESGFKVIAHCEALTAIFPLRSSIHGGTDGRTFCKQLLISRALLWQKHRDEEQGINMSRLLYLWQFYKGLLRHKILWVCVRKFQCFY